MIPMSNSDARKRLAERADEETGDLDLTVAVRHELIEHVLGLDAESVVDRVILPLREALVARLRELETESAVVQENNRLRERGRDLRARLEAAKLERDDYVKLHVDVTEDWHSLDEQHTALRDAITQLADEWDALDMGTGLYPEDSAHREAHEARSQQCADDLRALIRSTTGGDSV